METSEIYHFLWKDDIVSSYVMLVAPCDILPHVPPDSKERSYILNTLTYNGTLNSPLCSRGRGHWFVLTSRHGSPCEIFDSLGGNSGGSGIDNSGDGSDGNSYGSSLDRSDDGTLCSSDNVSGSRGGADRSNVLCNPYVKNYTSMYDCINVNDELLNHSLCGYYCLVYVYFRSRGINFDRVMSIIKSTNDIKSLCLTLYI